MSHFSVAVFTPDPHDVERIMEPFNVEDDRYFEEIPYIYKQDYIDKYKRLHPNTTYDDETIWSRAGFDHDHVNYDEGYVYDYFNPNGTWDYWDVGGRWRQSLCVSKHAESIGGTERRDGRKTAQRGKTRWVNGARIKDVLWGKVNKATSGTFKKLDMEWDEIEMMSEGYRKMHLLNIYGNKENYIMWNSLFATHAFVSMEDGIWHDQDSYDKKEFLEDFYDIVHDPQYQDWWIVIVDCHI